MDEPKPQVKLEVVEATMSSPMLHAGAVESAVAPDIVAEVPEPPEVPELPRIVVAREIELRIEVVIVIAVAIAGSFFAADGRVGWWSDDSASRPSPPDGPTVGCPSRSARASSAIEGNLDGRAASRKTTTSTGTGRRPRLLAAARSSALAATTPGVPPADLRRPIAPAVATIRV